MTADTASLAENTTPAPRRFGWLRRLLVGLFTGRRKLTRAEQKEIDSEKLERARQKGHEAGLRLEAEHIARDLIGKLKDKGVRYEYKKKDGAGSSRFKLVQFMRPYVIRQEAIYLKVDLRPGHSPPGIGVKELSNPEILPDLEIAVGHPVKHFYSAKTGFWYIVEREVGRRGIPNHVKYDEVLAKRPAHLDGLALPLGIDASKRIVWKSLNRMYSLMIAGSPGTGKSNVINAMICAMLRYNSPRELRLVLVDLKGGVEFTFYQDVPHLLPVMIKDGKSVAIIEHRDDVLPALGWLIGEGERRLDLMKGKRAKNIGDYNRHWGPLAHIVLVIDEWADVKVEPKLGNRAEELLVNVSNRFRAAGIHVILSTQSPTKEVISLRIKNAIPGKLAFSMSNIYASMLVVGNSQAYRLEPEGRAIFEWNQYVVELQTPLINNDTVDSMVAQAIAGEWDDTPPAPHDVTDQEVLQWAIDHNEGFIEYMRVYEQFRGRGLSKEYAAEFGRRMEGQTVMVSSTAYKVMPQAKANQGRRLLPADQAEELSRPKEKAAPAPPVVTPLEVCAWALAENDGKLQKNSVWGQFRMKGLSNKAAGDLCAALEGEVVEVDGRRYRVLPAVKKPGYGTLPRRLEPLDPIDSADPAPAPEPVPSKPGPEPAGQPAAETVGELSTARRRDGAGGGRQAAHETQTIPGTAGLAHMAKNGKG